MCKSFNIKTISLLFVVALIFGTLVPTTTRACACGMLMPEDNKEISMNKERGLVVFDSLKNSEQMAIDFQLNGTSSSTALVVPTPVRANISQIKTEVFDDLESIAYPPIMRGAIDSKSSDNSVNSVQVLEIKTVGNFEIAVLKTNSYKDLFDWTKSNGYYLEAEAESPVRTYIDKGFVLNVIKLKKDADTSNINPLEFTFKTNTIFYPLMEVKDSRDSQKDKSLDLYLLTDSKITDLSILSNDGVLTENKEISIDRLNYSISKANDPDFSNLNFTASKYYLTFISTDNYSNFSMAQSLGNPSAVEYTPLGLDYSHSKANLVPSWVYVVAIATVSAVILAAFFLIRRKVQMRQRNKASIKTEATNTTELVAEARPTDTTEQPDSAEIVDKKDIG